MNLAPLMLCGLATGAALALPPQQDHPVALLATDRPVAQAVEGLFPAARAGFRIEVGPETSPTLYDVVQAYGEATGQAFLLSPDTRHQLQTTESGLTRSLDVPAERVQAIFEQFLRANDMILGIRHAGQPRLLTIVSLNGPERANARSHSLEVDVEDIALWQDHAALLVSTVVHLPNTDVRQLSNSLRTLVIDANTQQLLPAGNSNNLVLTGFGSDVASMVRMLQRVDRASQIESPEQDAQQFSVVVLEHAQAHEVAAILNQLLNEPPQPSPQGGVIVPRSVPTVVADLRTNSLLLRADPERMEGLSKLIALLDRPTPQHDR